jgi:hypothetical protein
MDERTTTLQSSLFMFVLGISLGLVIQVLVLAVQNSVDYRDLGTGTSGATFFRSIGSSVGVAVFGTVFNRQLTSHLTSGVPVQASGRCSPAVLVGATHGAAARPWCSRGSWRRTRTPSTSCSSRPSPLDCWPSSCPG